MHFQHRFARFSSELFQIYRQKESLAPPITIIVNWGNKNCWQRPFCKNIELSAVPKLVELYQYAICSYGIVGTI